MKKIYSIIISIFIYQIIFSQTSPGIEWQNNIGGNDYDFLNSVQQTTDGGYILGGYSGSRDYYDKTEDKIGGSDYWVIKLDANGGIEWQNTIGGLESEYLYSIQQTAEGGYILGGYSSSGISGDKTEAFIGGHDYWVVKLDDDGDIEWQNTIGGAQEDYLYSIQQTIEGGYILGGYSYSGISGDKTEASLGSADYWVVKLDDEGNIEWQNTVGGSDIDILNCVQQTSNGGYILGGYSGSNISGNKTENHFGTGGNRYDYWVVKLDGEGEIEWQNTIGGSSYDYLESVEQTIDGGYILGGVSNSGISEDKTEARIGHLGDYWVIKLNNDGNIEWQNTIGGSEYDYLQSVQQTSDGGYILGGYSNSDILGDKTEKSYDSYDYWVVKLDEDGSVEWENTIGGTQNDRLYSIQETSDGGYMLGGDSESSISGDKTEENFVFNDYWVIKLYPEESEPCIIAPSGLFATNITTNKAKLNWTADAGAIKYKVQYRQSTSPVWLSLNATSNVKTLNGLAANTTYKYRVRSLCGPGLMSEWSSVAEFTTLPLKEGELFTENNFDINIYPNPNNGIFTLNISELNAEENLIIPIAISIKNILGEEIYSEKIISSELNHQINLNKNIPDGIYVVELSTTEKIFSQQIIISK